MTQCARKGIDAASIRRPGSRLERSLGVGRFDSRTKTCKDGGVGRRCIYRECDSLMRHEQVGRTQIAFYTLCSVLADGSYAWSPPNDCIETIARERTLDT